MKQQKRELEDSALVGSNLLLALDQSTKITGYAVFNGQELIAHGHVTFSGSDYINRIVQLRQWLNGIIDSVDGSIQVALEDIQLQDAKGTGVTGLPTYKKLAHVQGALMTLLEEKRISYQLVLASSWKSTCGVKGKRREEQKKNAQLYVKNTYGFDPTSDEADAICLGLHVLKHDWSN